MALYVLFVTLDLNVHFHYCAEDHHFLSSFGDAAEHCDHCVGHCHHALEMTASESELVHFDSKCCCEEFDSEIAFYDAFTFSTEKPLTAYLPVTMMTGVFPLVLDEVPSLSFHRYVKEKKPYLLTGRLKTIFFSHLKLNPLVF